MQIHGRWYDGKSSKSTEATLAVAHDGQLEVRDQAAHSLLGEAHASAVSLSSRLGNSARFVRFASGAAFETTDNAAVDQLQRQWQPGRWRGVLHKLESHLGLVVCSAVLLVGLAWAGALYGVPATARVIAFSLPQDTLDRVSKETLGLLDRMHFSPSELPEQTRNQVREEFAPVLAQFPELPLKVEFRKGSEQIGANAFALPDGTIIFTDQMIELSKSADERGAILAHEIGHVALRHSLRAVIQNAVIGFVYVTLVGDGSAMGDLLIGLPVLATTLAYSRGHESEADAFSAEYLDRAGIDRQAFVDVMQRLGETMRCRYLIDEQEDVSYEQLSDKEHLALCETLAAEQGEDTDSSWMGYLSTHPELEERLEDFRSL
ncbi:M48 family metallopeptidase [Gilvimarinus algae]|uniref:M48 family metallopeptidase n=1 Tax=Gilvimarinus algae TaxID=3058037 RepID=A0ABT8TH06_9GAMM|nr:M48 family metallopeptidase [Gilvimarinus sp. SDUM040014]MDO3381971.1 M48 family metallopeptidase [Gilvimarinus sp. SDUM040014]